MSDKSDYLSLIRSRKKSQLLLLYNFLGLVLYNKSFNFSPGRLMCHEKIPDSRYFNFLLHEYGKIKTHISGLFFMAHRSTRAQIEAFVIKKKL